MRALFSLLVMVLLTAAGPTDGWKALLKAGKEKEALAQVRKAADAGDPAGLDWMGWFYDEGRAVAADKVKAADFYRRAAEKGEPHAQWRYGVMLDTAEGVPLDSIAAMGWFRKSAAQDFSNAYASMGVMYSGGRGVQRDYAKALDSYRQAAKLHNVHAFNEIGVVYTNGEGVPTDRVEAAAYFMIAASYGDTAAKKYLQTLWVGFDADSRRRAVERANALAEEYKIGSMPDTSGLKT